MSMLAGGTKQATAMHEQHCSNVDDALGNNPTADDHNPRPRDDDDNIVPEVQLKAGCNIQQGATKFLRASLGVRRMPHPLHADAAHGASGSCGGAQQIDTPDNQMLVTTSDGQVLAVNMTDADPLSQQSEVKSSRVELQRAKWVSSMSAFGALQLEPLAVDGCILDSLGTLTLMSAGMPRKCADESC